MTFLQLVQRFRQESAYANTGPSTVASQTGDHARAVSWVADAYTELQARHQWRWLRKGFTLSLSSGTDTYDYTSAIDALTSAAISRFKAWEVNDPYNPPKCYLTSAGSGTEYWLTYLSWENFRTIYKIGTQVSGMPAHVTVDPNDNLVFGPSPDGTYTVTGEFDRSAQVLTANSDDPEMPDDFHMLIVYGALQSYGLFRPAPEFVVMAETKSRPLMRRLEALHGPRLRVGGPMA